MKKIITGLAALILLTTACKQKSEVFTLEDETGRTTSYNSELKIEGDPASFYSSSHNNLILLTFSGKTTIQMTDLAYNNFVKTKKDSAGLDYVHLGIPYLSNGCEEYDFFGNRTLTRRDTTEIKVAQVFFDYQKAKHYLLRTDLPADKREELSTFVESYEENLGPANAVKFLLGRDFLNDRLYAK